MVVAQSDARRRRDAGHFDGGGAVGGGPIPGGPIPELASTGAVPLEPQHLIAPPVSRAHECEPPRAMLVAVVIPVTLTGVVLSVVVPSPT